MNHDSYPHSKAVGATESPIHQDNVSEFRRLPKALRRIIELAEGGDPPAVISTDNTGTKARHPLEDDHIDTPNAPSR